MAQVALALAASLLLALPALGPVVGYAWGFGLVLLVAIFLAVAAVAGVVWQQSRQRAALLQ